MNYEQHPLFKWLSQIRRDLHRHPEIGYQEVRTTSRIKEILRELGIPNQDLPGMDTGVVGLIEGRPGGKTLALRADIDALPIKELNEIPYKSTAEGVMHACGHDAHTTIMLGVAKHVMESGLKDKITGNLKFIFQPAEEKISGAEKMIRAGVLKKPKIDRIVACHMDPDLQVGQVAIFKGVSHAAADLFRMHIQGKGGHGAIPEDSIDPIVAGAHFVTALQTIVSREISPMEPSVITVGSLRAGTAGNIIPDEAVLEGTVRSLKPEVRDKIIARIAEMVAGLEKTFNVKVKYQYTSGVPPCMNDETVSEFLFEAASEIIGSDHFVELKPAMVGEDFALFSQRVPGSIMRLGCTNKERSLVHKLHSPHFDLDENVLVIGVEIFTEAIKRYIGGKNEMS
jgi:amidohydrolase